MNLGPLLWEHRVSATAREAPGSQLCVRHGSPGVELGRVSGWSPGLGVLAASSSSTDSGPVFRRAGGQGCSQHMHPDGQKKACLPTPHSGEQTPSNRKMTEEPSERDGMLNMSARDIRPERKWKGVWGRLCKTALVLRGLWAWSRAPLVRGTQSCDAGRGTGRAPGAGLALSCCQAPFRLHQIGRAHV